MKAKRPAYLSYLIRLWRSGDDGASWQIMLVNPHTGDRHSFASLGEVVAFLQEAMAWSE